MTNFVLGLIKATDEYISTIPSTNKIQIHHLNLTLNVERLVSLEGEKYLLVSSSTLTYSSLHHNFLALISKYSPETKPIYLIELNPVEIFNTEECYNNFLYIRIPTYIVNQLTESFINKVLVLNNIEKNESLLFVNLIKNKLLLEEIIEYFQTICIDGEYTMTSSSFVHSYTDIT